MNFRQLRAMLETARSGFNLTDVADILHTSQPAISRQIRELEDELGVEIFVRAGKRLTGLTAPGEAILTLVERLLLDAENLARAGEDFSVQGSGSLSIAATHSQARYATATAIPSSFPTSLTVLNHSSRDPVFGGNLRYQLAAFLHPGRSFPGINRLQAPFLFQSRDYAACESPRILRIAALAETDDEFMRTPAHIRDR